MEYIKYGDKRDYPKIELFSKRTGKYLGTTTWSRTVKEAESMYETICECEVKGKRVKGGEY